ncbi:MAG: response regulator [Rickettsiales bacterium]
MSKKPNLKNVSILIADPDTYIARAMTYNLRAMGFTSISHVKNSADAVRAISINPTSFLITEWDMKGSNGLDLVRFMRRSPNSPNRALPIIMFTGRSEMSDVKMARDAGITEFAMKPFSAQDMYKRIEQVIDHPRSFVMANGYVGPERRRHGLPPPGMEDRRILKPIAAPSTRDALREPPGKQPVIFAPDLSIRQSIGITVPLSTFITPDILKEAQKAIDALGDESQSWIREDIAQMQEAYGAMKKVYTTHAHDSLQEAVLSIKARAGTFGYRLASDVARLCFVFLSTHFSPTILSHLIVIQKHIEVLTVIFAKDIKEREGMGAELYTELERLMNVNK